MLNKYCNFFFKSTFWTNFAGVSNVPPTAVAKVKTFRKWQNEEKYAPSVSATLTLILYFIKEILICLEMKHYVPEFMYIDIRI